MRKLALVLLASAVAWPALAADLYPVVKAKPRVLFSYVGSGIYYGLGTFGEVDKARVEGPNGQAVSAYMAGGSVYGVLGYMVGDGTTWKAVEAIVHYNNVGSTSPLGAVNGEIHSKVGFTQRVLLGGPIAGMLSVLPNLSTVFPVLPVAAGPSGSHPYFFAAVHEDDVSASYMLASHRVWRIRGGFGVGVQHMLGTAGNIPGASQVTMDTWVEYIAPGTGLTLGLPSGLQATANTGGSARVGAALKY